MKRDRVAEIHFYEWRIGAWAISETRDRLDSSGRGIYRELLDHCYGQGKIPDDPEWICRRCACTQEQYEKAWKVIARHFPKIEGTEYRYNVHSDIVRGEYFAYVEKQRANRKCRDDKSNKINDEHYDCTTMSENVSNGGSTNGNGNGNGNVTATAMQRQEVKPSAPSGALRPRVPLRKGKRTSEEIRCALNGRLPWWEEFWKVYPCHEGMNPAMDAFERRVQDHDLAVEMYRAAKRYAAKLAADPTAKPKYGQGWINEERWTDETVHLVADAPKSIYTKG